LLRLGAGCYGPDASIRTVPRRRGRAWQTGSGVPPICPKAPNPLASLLPTPFVPRHCSTLSSTSVEDRVPQRHRSGATRKVRRFRAARLVSPCGVGIKSRKRTPGNREGDEFSRRGIAPVWIRFQVSRVDGTFRNTWMMISETAGRSLPESMDDLFWNRWTIHSGIPHATGGAQSTMKIAKRLLSHQYSPRPRCIRRSAVLPVPSS